MKENKDLGTFVNQDDLNFFPAPRNTALDRGGPERQYKPIGSLIAAFCTATTGRPPRLATPKRSLLIHRPATTTRKESQDREGGVRGDCGQ